MLSILGLTLLLLLSPCKVRNFIQAELDTPQTKALNKSQSTVSQFNCQTFEVSETLPTISKPTFKQAKILIATHNDFDFTSHSLEHSFNVNTSKSHAHADVPLYVLYQKLKVYS